MTSDAELLHSWNDGDAAAGEALVERYFPAMLRFFRDKAPRHCAELVQRTFVACLEKRATLRDAGSFRAFLYGIARIELLRHLQRDARAGREIDPSEVSMFALDPSPSRVVAGARQQRLLLEALRRIPLDLQIVVELHYWEELTTSEIAHVIGVPQGTVKSRLRRAREEIEAALASLTQDQALLQSTTTDLEDWVAGIKLVLQPDSET